MSFPRASLIAAVLTVTVSFMSFIPRAEAGMVAPVSPNESAASMTAEQDMRTIRATLENKLVQERLEQLGYSNEQVEARLKTLSEAELHALATNLDQVTPAGDGLGILIAIVVIALIIGGILYFTGKEVVVRNR